MVIMHNLRNNRKKTAYNYTKLAENIELSKPQTPLCTFFPLIIIVFIPEKLNVSHKIKFDEYHSLIDFFAHNTYVLTLKGK